MNKRLLIRSIKNVYRNKPRTVAVVLLLTFSLSLALGVFQASLSIDRQTRNIISVVQNVIEVRSAGTSGMAVLGEGGASLAGEVGDQIRTIPGVVRVEKQLAVRNRNPEYFPTVSVTMGNEPDKPVRLATHGEVATLSIVEGRPLTGGDAGQNVALVGKVYAENRGLRAGSTLLEKGTEGEARLEVVGIFSSGFSYGDNQVVVPLDVVQRLYGQQGKTTLLWVTVNSVSEMRPVVQELRTSFGGSLDIVTAEGKVQFLEASFQRLLAVSIIGLVLALLVAGVVVFFAMVLTAQERTREIGVLKAIGAPNSNVGMQFIIETVALVSLSALLALVGFALLGPALVNPFLGIREQGPTPGVEMGLAPATSLLEISYQLSPETAAATLGLALLLGVLGSLYPVWRATRMRPAEALRYG